MVSPDITSIDYRTEDERQQKEDELIAAKYKRNYDPLSELKPGEYRLNEIDTESVSFKVIPTQFSIAWRKHPISVVP